MFVYFKRINLKKISKQTNDLVEDLDLELFGEKGKVYKIFDKLCIQNKFKLFFYCASSFHLQPVMSQFFEEYIINKTLPKNIDLGYFKFEFMFTQYLDNKLNAQDKINYLFQIVDKCGESIENRNFWL